MIAGLMGLLLFVVTWSALGCYALRDFSYSRLDEFCESHGEPNRFSIILKQQESALLALELLLTFSTLAFAAAVCFGIGWPGTSPQLTWSRELVSFFIEYAVFVIAVLFAGDILPWTIARVASEPFLFHFWPLIRVVQWTFSPLLGLAKIWNRQAHRWMGRGEPEQDDAAILDEEIRTVVDEGQREGYLESGARAMIHRVMEIQDEVVGAIMTPRTDMFCIQVDSSLEEAREQLLEGGHSRVPVIGDSPDDIIGMLYAKDLLRALAPHQAEQRIVVLRDIVRDPVHVPESFGIAQLLEMMQRQRVQIAIVLDEYGGVAGLVTMEDILEEIVGEISDEYDEHEIDSTVQPLDSSLTEVDGRVHIDDLNRDFNFGIPEDGEYETVSGFVFAQFGRIPAEGEVVDWNNLRFTVLGADQRKINRLRIEVLSQPPT